MRREIPGVLWVGMSVLGLVSVIQLVVGIAQGSVGLLVSVAVNVVLLFGIYHGRRWAFVILLTLSVLGILVGLVRNPALGIGVLVLNGFVIVPVLLAKDYFWGPRLVYSGRLPNFCGRCGQDLARVTGRFCPNCGNEVAVAGGPE
jgi:hypothetical protein